MLTGRRRHRVGWFGRLILQVEERERIPTAPYGEAVTHRWWRDARAQDVTTTPESEGENSDG